MSVGGRLPTGPTQLRHPQGGGTMTMGREGGVPETGAYIIYIICSRHRKCQGETLHHNLQFARKRDHLLLDV